MKRLTAWILVMLTLAGGLAAAEPAEELIDALLTEQTALSGQENLQGWIDTALTETADGTGGWYLIALRRLEKMGWPGTAGLDWRTPRAALEKAAEKETGGITKRERMALTLQALGSGSPFIGETARAAAEETTLMPLVFALHLMNNGAEAGVSREEIAARLRALQLADGGWAVIGEKCDPDCTAMTLLALAPMREDPGTAESIARGLDALAEAQTETGGYLSMGGESAESAAQVLLALSSLGVDAAADPRFIRNGHGVQDEMMRFRTENGFAHDLNSGKWNETATMQCFYALVGTENARRGGGPYYVFDFAPTGSGGGIRLSWKAWAWMAAGLGLAAAWALALIRKKRNWRSYLFPALTAAALAAVIAVIEIQSPEGFYRETRAPAGERNLTTTISIRCDTIAGENAYAPADGVILAEREIRMAEGETAFDQLMEAVKDARIQMEFDGTAAGAYVRGIGYLYEYQFGNLSGWMYRVNGVYSDVGCSQYQMKDGDRVEWVYTRSLGKDE